MLVASTDLTGVRVGVCVCACVCVCVHQPVQLVAGLVASGSILIEKKSRRSELALYVMPRAVDSFVLALTKKRCLPSIKFGEVILFSLCMGGLMYYRYILSPYSRLTAWHAVLACTATCRCGVSGLQIRD